MPLDKINYTELINKILDAFSQKFGEDILLDKVQEKIEHMGYFKIEYRYLPLQYNIIFENERNLFCIEIADNEGAKNSLYRIERFDNKTDIENVEYAVQKLREVLIKDDFYFYLTRNGKLYKKKNQQYKRVKDLTELIGENYGRTNVW